VAAIIIDGRVRVTWCTTIANIAAPTTTELNAGSALEGLLTPDGLNVTASTNGVDVSTLKSTFTTMRAGRRSFDVSLTFHHDDTSDLGFTLFTYRTTGYLVIRRPRLAATDATTAWLSTQNIEVYPLDTGERTEVPPKPDGTYDLTIPFFLMADPNTRAVVA
jgi:hypothetical protein